MCRSLIGSMAGGWFRQGLASGSSASSTGSSGVSRYSTTHVPIVATTPARNPKRNRPMRLILLPIVALSTLLAAPAVAQPGPDCQPADEMKDHLARKYNESQVASGVSLDGTLVMIFAKPDNS